MVRGGECNLQTLPRRHLTWQQASVLVSMGDLRALFLDPSKSFFERSLNLPFHAVNLVFRYPFLPLCFWIAESPRLFTPLSRLRRPTTTPTVAFAAHHLHPPVTTVRPVTRPVTLHVLRREEGRERRNFY